MNLMSRSRQLEPSQTLAKNLHHKPNHPTTAFFANMKHFIALSMMALAQATTTFPTRELAGVTVIDTPLVRASEIYARAHSNDYVYKHIMRSWLYGVLLIEANDLTDQIDLEIHAVAAILHDLGWDQTPNSTLISPDRRFEVDGAVAARNFIRKHHDGETWDERRVQLVWDAIALHAEPSIRDHKELEVRVVGQGIFMDAFGPSAGVSEEDYALVVEVFPDEDFIPGLNETMVWLCQTKPATTYGK